MSGIIFNLPPWAQEAIYSEYPLLKAQQQRMGRKAKDLLIQEGRSPDEINALSDFVAFNRLTNGQGLKVQSECLDTVVNSTEDALRSRGGGNHREKLALKIVKDRFQNHKNDMEGVLALAVKNQLRLAEIRGVPPHQLHLSEQEIRKTLQEIDAARANKAFEDLMNEPSKTKKTKKRNKPSQITPSKSRGPSPVPSPAKAAKAPPKQQMPWSDRVLLLLQTSPDLKSPEHPRVTERWKPEDLEEIKAFDDGKYAQMDETALKVQRARHFLPGLERIFNTKSTKALYTFQTSNHSPGILCEMTYASGQKEEGVVYLGFGTENRKLLIHRYFEPFKSFKEANEVFAGRRVEQLQLEKESEWISTTPYQFEKMEADGTIQLKFTGEGHSLRIFPAKREKVASLINN